MIDWYDKELTTESFKELVKFVEWCNKVQGLHPIIIGGWSVYAYTKGLGSRDVDIILPTNQSIQDLLLPYYQAANFARKGLLTKEFFKEIQTKDGIEKIYLDVSCYQNRNILKENNGIEIPWNLLEDYNQNWNIGEKTICRIPEIELLIVYKVKALRDRQYDKLSRGLDLTSIQRDYLNAKIWKDKEDIKSLLAKDVAEEKLNEILEKTKFKEYFDKSIAGVKAKE